MIVVSVKSLIVFEAYTTQFCSFKMWSGPERVVFPITDYAQGIPSQVKLHIYNNNPVPDTLGQWTNITSTQVTFRYTNGTLQSWAVVLKTNTAVCDSTPMYGFGRFYEVPGPAMLVLQRTSGDFLALHPEYCNDKTAYGWIAYLMHPLLNTSSPCPSIPSVYYDGGSELTFYQPGGATWTQAQPCGVTEYPGKKCATSGTAYCMKNENCMMNVANKPGVFPLGGTKVYTIKIVNENKVGGSIPEQPTMLPSSASRNGLFFGMLLINMLF